jgi:hypothetical protein
MLGHSLVSTTILRKERVHEARYPLLFASRPPQLFFSSAYTPLGYNHTLQHHLFSVLKLAQVRPTSQSWPSCHYLKTTIMASITATLLFLLMAYTALAQMIPIPPGWKQGHSLQELKAATHLNAKRQDVSTKLSPEVAALIEQIQSAQYALDLCNSGFNLTEVCEELRDSKAITPLSNVGIDSSQAGDIVCFVSEYGIDLNTTNAALLGDLAAAVYGLELGDNFTATINTTKLCNNIDLAAASYLGIDTGSVNSFICGGSVTVTSTATQTTVVIPGSPTVTFTASGVSTGGGYGGSTTGGSIVSASTAFSRAPTTTEIDWWAPSPPLNSRANILRTIVSSLRGNVRYDINQNDLTGDARKGLMELGCPMSCARLCVLSSVMSLVAYICYRTSCSYSCKIVQ